MQRDELMKVTLILLILLVMLGAGCSRKSDEMIPIGPEVKSDLVVFFKADAAHDEIEKFVNETISTREERGFRPLPGIQMVSHVSPIDGHEGYAIKFFPEATEAQREYVKSRVKSSPIMYKVMENVAPVNIKTVD